MAAFFCRERLKSCNFAGRLGGSLIGRGTVGKGADGLNLVRNVCRALMKNTNTIMNQQLMLSAADAAELRNCVRSLCKLCGGRFVLKEEPTPQVFPKNNYSYLSEWLQDPDVAGRFQLLKRPWRVVADELTEAVGWDVDERQLRRSYMKKSLSPKR